MKPSCLSRGRGIFLLDQVEHALCTQASVVQRYVADPLLLAGHKFDLRLYVLVTSFNPLEAFVYQVRSVCPLMQSGKCTVLHAGAAVA